jgi:hypothetical protein
MGVFDFLYRYIHHTSEFAAFLISIIYWRYYSKTFMKWTASFLGVIFIGELLAMTYPIVTLAYFIISVIEAVYYGHIFYNLIEGKRVRVAIIVVIFVSIVCYVISYFFLDTNMSMYFNSMALVLFGFLISAVALVYLYQLFDRKQTIMDEPGFWIAVGVIVFFSGISIVFCFYGLLFDKRLRFMGWPLYRLIPRVLSVLLYGSFIVSILTCKRKVIKTNSLPV